jgi:hypothetical protein
MFSAARGRWITIAEQGQRVAPPIDERHYRLNVGDT